MKPPVILCLIVAFACWAADGSAVAARLGRRASKARDNGQTVRAYLLFAEAAARDPKNPTYRANRDALAPVAQLLTKAEIQTADIQADVLSAQNEAAHPEPPIQRISKGDWQTAGSQLKSIPHVHADAATHSFDLRSDAKSLVTQVAATYGVRAICDTALRSNAPIHFEIAGADFRAALNAVTVATGTFVFPVSENTIYFAPDTDAKRNELEPVIVLTFPLQEALTERELIDAANAVRGLLNLRTIGWDSLNRMVMIRDRFTRAHVARSLIEALLLPRAQVSFEVQFLVVNSDRNYHYGASLQTMFQLINFGDIGGIKSVIPAAVGSTQFLTFGGGATLFGVAVADARAFANYSNSETKNLFDATVVVADKQTANLHIGDQYPIPTSLYTGFQQGTASIYNPVPQITMESLGLLLKMTPHMSGSGDIGLDLEAQYKTLGNQTFNTVPSVDERLFKGSVNLKEGEWAIVAGMDASVSTFTRNGLAGIGQIPGIKQLFTETTRDTQTSNIVLVIKPTITRLPMTELVRPQFFLGPRKGERVLI